MRIPLICRILAVADAYDASDQRSILTEKQMKSREEAMLKYEKMQEPSLDPYIVRIFLDIV